MTKKKIPKLLVVFDTNVLFTQIASELVRNDVKRIVKENSKHPDLILEWYLPEVVVGERKYQMLGKAKELLPSMQKLEKLLGHNFGIGDDTLELNVDKAINNSLLECEFQIATIDTIDIDWKDIISRSTKRKPPFEANEKEKGFRDSIIAHSFLRLHNNSPSTPNVCRLALVSEDQRLREYVEELTINSKNVRILSGLDELESLINTLVSTVTEEFAGELAEKASKLFFEKGDDKTFYYKDKIGEKIREQYSKELNEKTLPNGIRSNGTWWILKPIFVKKERQRIHWITTIELEFEIYHYEPDDSSKSQQFRLAEIFGSQSTNTGLGIGASNPSAQSLVQGLLGGLAPKKVVDIKGKEKFEIHWNTILSPSHNLTAPKLEKMEYVGNNLSEDRTL